MRDLGRARRVSVSYSEAVIERQGLTWKPDVMVMQTLRRELAERLPPELNSRVEPTPRPISRSQLLVEFQLGACPCGVCGHRRAEECHAADCQCCSEQCT